MRCERAIFCGAGGQGLLTIGKLLAGLAVERFPHVTYIPSYGAEVRGGVSNCRVILSDGEIASPVVEQADAIVAMNQPSADRFLPMLVPDGTAFVNTSLVVPPAGLERVVALPATQWAQEFGDIRTANMVMLGAYLGRRDLLVPERVLRAIEECAPRVGRQTTDANRRCFPRGWDAARA